MPRCRGVDADPVVHRTARIGLRLTHRQRQRCFGLLRAGGDVWMCVLEVNAWRRRRGDRPAVLRRYSDAWFSAAARRKAGALEVRYPRRRRALIPIRWCHGTFTLSGRWLRLPTARGSFPLSLRLDRPVPYPADSIRSVTLLYDGCRLVVDVTWPASGCI
jgi:putative transposase